jgi:hypothetical protein
MKNSSWKECESLPGEFTQLRLFPPTPQEILTARLNEIEAKLERQRKGQFGKIGRSEKRLTELESRLEILERGICQMNECKTDLHCQIFEMVAQ